MGGDDAPIVTFIHRYSFNLGGTKEDNCGVGESENFPSS